MFNGELIRVREALARLVQWLSPKGRTGDIEVADEFPVSQWIDGGESRGAGSAESYHLGPELQVRIHPVPAKAASEVDVSYTGFLANTGAEKIYVRCGDGPGAWENVRDIPLEWTPDTGEWTAKVRVSEREGTMEFCFHDGADNWDNNHGRNWSVTVLKNNGVMMQSTVDQKEDS